MEKPHPASTEAILKKHTDLTLDMVIIGSVTKQGQVLIDISAPGDLSTIVFLHHCLSVQIAEMTKVNVLKNKTTETTV